jgi:hypothetical protein
MLSLIFNWIVDNAAEIAGGGLCFGIAFLLTYQDFSVRIDADSYSNFINPLFHWKSLFWFALIGSIAMSTFVMSLHLQGAFFETISLGQSQPIIRGFLIGFVIVAILKSSFMNMKESRELGIGALYYFIQGKFLQTCRRDSVLKRSRLVDQYTGRFGSDDSFVEFLSSILESEIRALPYTEKRKNDLREPFESVRKLLQTADTVEKRTALYDRLLDTSLVVCSVAHMHKLLRRRLAARNHPSDPQSQGPGFLRRLLAIRS